MNQNPRPLRKTRLIRGYRCLKNGYLNIRPSIDTRGMKIGRAVIERNCGELTGLFD